VAQEALASGRRVADLVLEKGWMTRAQLEDALRPEALTRPQYSAAHWPRAEG
jgi:aspartate ammonia-lyase